MGVENEAKVIRGRLKSREKMRTSRTPQNLTVPISIDTLGKRVSQPTSDCG